MTLLVLGKRVLRGRAEARSQSRRAAWTRAFGPGPVRSDVLERLAREAAHSAAAQEDLLTLLQTGALDPSGPNRAAFEAALHAGGFVRALPIACRSGSGATRGRAVLLWARLGLKDAVQGITPLMADPDADVRSAAIHAIALCRSEEAAWTLLRALRDGHVPPERIVERLTGEWAVPPLLRALRQLSYGKVRPWLAEALGLIGDPRAEAPLTGMLARGDEEQRTRACRALGRLGLPGSFTAFVEALGDESASVRAQAARALADLGDPRCVGTLVGLLADDSWWVRARAADALRRLGEPGIAALEHCARLHPDPFARERAAEALGLHAAELREAATA